MGFLASHAQHLPIPPPPFPPVSSASSGTVSFLIPPFDAVRPSDAVSGSTDVPKLARPLNGSNFQDWKRDIVMILVFRDYDIDEPQPLDRFLAARWTKTQHHILAIIHLNCDTKQDRLFRSARTGKQAWDILNRRYASSSAPNVMRLDKQW